MAKAGRPTKYKPEYCDQLVDHMTDGYSFESFAGKCEVNIDTLYHWCTIHPSFSEAKKIAVEKCRLFWERMGIEGLRYKDFNATVWIFNMKNRFKWRDNYSEVEQTEKPQGSVYKLHDRNKSDPKAG